MKKLVLFVFAVTLLFSVDAQIRTPQPSPAAKIEQVVGLTDVSIDYSRPSMRGRVIFGNLVPYGKVWRTGANARTKVTFSDDVTVGDNELKAGTYAIFTIPQAESWDVVFYTDYAGGGAPAELDESKIAARVTAKVYPIEMDIQSFTISFDDITNNSAVIGIMWERSYVGIEFKVPTDAKVSASIEKTMAGPGAGDYYSAAVYNLTEGKDLDKAKEWMDKAMSMTENPRFWQLRQQSLLYAKLGDKKKAIETAKKSLAGAEAAGNADYIKMNKDSLKEWGAM
ncbi:DUF2911 domain-containing protein [Winogradskyella vincentii]|uniref:DUF2911 domain-containing protein n=1 Tax=Winogradskyella vincentii TaxID=2877122 RepID=A0ABS7Y2P3_9FLAO|nr:DUF2911 domain-containing protein [Winogradskyella vincentii]MCA0154209.1 DUF2911 domain-containing protein [Winogradskyella vincentii]